MAYIGQGIKNGTFTVLDTSGNTYNGSNVTFSLGTQVGSAAQLLVSHDGVIQKPGTDYSLATGGTQITFSTAPASGASIFIVEISGAVGGPMNRDLDGDELVLDTDGDTSITADTDDQIDIKVAGTDQITIKDGALSPVTDNDIDLGTSSLEFKDAFFDGTVTTDGLTVSGTPSFADGSIAIADLDIDGGTDIGANIADSDLIIIDDGAGGTNRKSAVSRLKTYIGGGTLVEVDQASISAGSSVGAVEFSNIFSSSYNTYFVRMSKIRFAGDTRLQMRFYSDTGTTEYSGSYYYYVSYGLAVGGAEERNNESGANRLYLTETLDQDQPADGGATGFFYIDNPLANDNFSVTCIGQVAYRDTSNVWNGTNFNGKYSGSSPRYGFKLYGSSNVEYADITVYGVKP